VSQVDKYLGSDELYASSRIRKELFRKAVHIFGFSIPFISIVAGVSTAVVIIIALAMAYSVSEYLRLKGRNFPLLAAVTKMAMRDADKEKQNIFVRAPLYFAAGILVSLLILPAPFNYAAIAVVTLGDGFASIAGRLCGRHKVPQTGGKTVEGSVAGFICAFAGAAIFVSPATALIAAIIGITLELLPLRVTDNLTIPLLSGLSISIIGNL
jgi:phytol kinase